MKKMLALSLMALFSSMLAAQVNLVPNPSFEDTIGCPDYLDQVYKAAGWSSVRNTPDYFNACAPTTGFYIVSVPSNWAGYQYPASGNAYCGLAARIGPGDIREFIGTTLTSVLQIGTKYFVSFKVSLYDNSNSWKCAVNKLGALFSTQNYSVSNPAPICNCSQVFTDSVITDSLNWVMIKGSFIANDNYSFISIGNFFVDSLTDSIQIQGPLCQAYYYVDDVCVSTDSLYCFNYTYTGIIQLKNETIITYYPNPCHDELIVEDEFNLISTIKILKLICNIA